MLLTQDAYITLGLVKIPFEISMPQKGAAAQWYIKCNSVFQVVGSILDSVKVAPGLVLDRICLSDEIFFIISGCLTANS